MAQRSTPRSTMHYIVNPTFTFLPEAPPSQIHNSNHGVAIAEEPKNVVSRFVQRSQTIYSQLSLSEISGSLGDLGTLVPLVVALSRQRAIHVVPSLFLAGFANVVTGYVWDVPMCVQPMKAISAVAISEVLTREQVTAAGVWMGILVFTLGVTDFIEVVNKIVPISVVCGVQLGVGLRLATKALTMVQGLSWWSKPDCILMACLCSLLCLWLLREPLPPSTTTSSRMRTPFWESFWRPPRQRPAGLYLFAIGSVMTAVELMTNGQQYDLPIRFFESPRVLTWALAQVTLNDWKIGFLEGALAQLPLTTLNSVISVCCLAHSLFPDKRRGDASNDTDAVVSRREVAMGVGLMNLLLCPFGGLPACHGAGGLAGQHRFGARHGSSVVFLGLNKMLLAAALGSSAVTLLDAFPASILGVLLAIAGQELATTGIVTLFKDKNNNIPLLLRKKAVVAMITALVIVALKKVHVGAVTGWVAHMIYGDGIVDCFQITSTTTTPDPSNVEMVSFFKDRPDQTASTQPKDDEPASTENDQKEEATALAPEIQEQV